MDTPSKIALGASLMCLFVALMAIWCGRVQAAATRNVKDEEREMLRRAARDTERLNNELRLAIDALLRESVRLWPLVVKTTKQTDRKPPRELPPTPPPMQDERFRSPAKKKARKR